MFQPPVGLHFRNVYFFSFVAIIFASESFQIGITRKNLFVSTGLSLILISIGYYFAERNNQLVSIKYFYWSIGFILLSGVLLGLSLRKINFQYLLMMTVCAELLINFLGGLQGSKFGREDLYQKYYQTESKAYQKIKQSDKGFYRVVNVKPLINQAAYIADSNNNDPLIFDVNGVSAYSSTLDSDTRQMMLDLGYYGRNIRSISPTNGTKLTDALFGVKYRLNGQKIVQSDALGMGTVVDKKITKVKLKSTDPIGNQERILNTLNETKQQYFVSPKVTGNTINSTISGNLYFVNKENVSGIVVDGKKIPVDAYEHNNVIDLGKINSGTDMNVKLLGTNSNNSNNFYVLNNQKLKQSIKVLNQQQLHLRGKFQSSKINGTVKISRSNQILLLNIPYGKGWTAKVDGKNVPIKQVIGNMSYLELKPGKHKINLKYQVSGLKLGLIISLLGLGLYIVLIIVL